MRDISAAYFLVLVLAAAVAGQTAAAGRSELTKAFEGAGSSAAAGRLRSGLGAALKKAAARRTAKPAPPAGTSRTSSRSRTAPVAASPARSSAFRPESSLAAMRTIADELGSTREERDTLFELFRQTKASFENEVAAKGRANDVASSLMFFITVTSMAYHDDPEPSDEAIDALWDGLNAVFAEMPEFGQMTDSDKQSIYDTFIAFGGLVLAGYMNAKETGDAGSLKAYRELAGELLRTVLKIDPEKIRFTDEGLSIS